jgi:small subunit ribosomal protein S13
MRLLGITIPDKKSLEIGLCEIYGVGKTRAKDILQSAEIPLNKKPKELSETEEAKIRELVAELKLEGELKREIATNIRRLRDLQCYRGIRHIKKISVRGQRTKTNSRTIRGNVRKTMGSGKKKVEKK